MSQTLRAAPLAALIALPLGVPAARADIYKYVDPQGMVHLADRRLGPGYRLILRTKKRRPASRLSPGKPAWYATVIDQAARRHGLNQALLHAVIKVESAYDARAVSKAGAMGLMQLMPQTARRYGARDPWDPRQNIQAGARYLKDLIDQFGNLRLALAAYNAGENAVKAAGNRIPPYPETQGFVQRVMGEFRHNLKAAEKKG